MSEPKDIKEISTYVSSTTQSPRTPSPKTLFNMSDYDKPNSHNFKVHNRYNNQKADTSEPAAIGREKIKGVNPIIRLDASIIPFLKCRFWADLREISFHSQTLPKNERRNTANNRSYKIIFIRESGK